MKKQGGIFYGWFLLAAVWLMQAVVVGLFNNCFSQLVVPVTEALGITRTQFSLTSSFAAIAMMVVSPLVGSVYSKGRHKIIIIVSGTISVLAWIGYSFATSTIMFYAFALILGISSTLCGAVITNAMLIQWFHARKGFALGFATTGSGFGSMVFNPLTSGLIIKYGYQTAIRYLGIIAIVLMLPLMILFVFSPEQKGLKPYGYAAGEEEAEEKDAAPVEVPGMTRAEALKTPKFYLLLVVCFTMAFGSMGVFMHMTPILLSLGCEAGQAASLISIISLVMAIVKLTFGALADKIGTDKTYLLQMTLATLGIGGFVIAKSYTLILISSVLYGFALATTNLLGPLVTIRVTGGKDFANINGIVAFAMCGGSFIASPLSAAFYDKMQTYSLALTIYAICYAAATVVGFMLLRHGYEESKK